VVRPAYIPVAHIDALEIEYSPWFTDHEHDGLLSTAKELGVSVIAYSPLGKGMLTGAYRKPEDFAHTGDMRKTTPRFAEYLEANLKLVDEFERIAKKKKCTPGQLSIAWIAAMGCIPILGRRVRVGLRRIGERMRWS